MFNHSRKHRSPDAGVTAYQTMLEVTGQPPRVEARAGREKSPAAVALGRLGGLKGGKARAKKLSRKKRSEIAKKAARERWSKSHGR